MNPGLGFPEPKSIGARSCERYIKLLIFLVKSLLYDTIVGASPTEKFSRAGTKSQIRDVAKA